MARPVEGAALLVAGHGAIGGTQLDVSAVHTLGQIGEALLVDGRVAASAASLRPRAIAIAADRGTLKRHLDELAAEPVRVVVLVCSARSSRPAGPALVTGERAARVSRGRDAAARVDPRAPPRDAKAEQLVVVLSGARRWRPARLARRARHGSPRAHDRDRRRRCGGTDRRRAARRPVRRRARSAHRHRHDGEPLQAPRRARADRRDPGLGSIRDVRAAAAARRPVGRPALAALAIATQRARKTPTTGEPDDLTGTVLPGRFRLDGSSRAARSARSIARASSRSSATSRSRSSTPTSIRRPKTAGCSFTRSAASVASITRTSCASTRPTSRTTAACSSRWSCSTAPTCRPLVRQGAARAARAIELVRQLLAGLGAAHDAGLVHADVKPANAIVVPRRRRSAERVVPRRLRPLAPARARSRRPSPPAARPRTWRPSSCTRAASTRARDLFSAALVLVYLLTGWRRPNASRSCRRSIPIADRRAARGPRAARSTRDPGEALPDRARARRRARPATTADVAGRSRRRCCRSGTSRR